MPSDSRPVAAVLIPTIASKRTKQKISRDQEISLWGKMIRSVILNSAASVQRSGFTPKIVVINNFQSENPQARQKIQAAIGKELGKLPKEFRETTVEIIECPGAGWMGSVLEGGKFAVQRGANAVVTLADDFETEAKEIGKLLKPVTRKNQPADFVFARWGKFAQSFPPAQTMNEITVSLLSTLANPQFKPKPGEPVMIAMQRAAREQHELQAYTGLMATNSQTFTEIEQFIAQRLSPIKRFGHAGLDPVMVPIALQLNKKVEAFVSQRRYEHFNPRSRPEQAKFIAIRQKQLTEAVIGVRAFLLATRQYGKLRLLNQLRQAGTEWIKTAPRQWGREDKRRARTAMTLAPTVSLLATRFKTRQEEKKRRQQEERKRQLENRKNERNRRRV